MTTDTLPDIPQSRLRRWRTRPGYHGLLLGVVCAVVTVSMLSGDLRTRHAIGQRQMEDRLANLEQVMPARLYDNNPLRDAVEITDSVLDSKPVTVYPARKQGKLAAVAFQVRTAGYGGDITLMIGLDAGGTVLGVRVLSHKETPGLADRIDIGKSDWITVFNGMSLALTPPGEMAVKKDGGRIDQFSGATITPRAVVKGVRASLDFYARHAGELAAPTAVSGRSS